MSCDIVEVTERLENEFCYDYNYDLCSFSNLCGTSPTSQLILQPFRRFTYVKAHSLTLPSLYLRHSSFSNPSVASPTSQFIIQPFYRFSYFTRSSLNSPGEPPMLPRWVISPMPGPSPRQHKHERRDTPSTYQFILTRRKHDYDGQMVFGVLVDLKLPDICLTGEEKPRRKPHPRKLSQPGIEPGPAACQARMLPPVPQRWTHWVFKCRNYIL